MVTDVWTLNGLSALDLEAPHVATDQVGNFRDLSVWSPVSLSSSRKYVVFKIPDLLDSAVFASAAKLLVYMLNTRLYPSMNVFHNLQNQKNH